MASSRSIEVKVGILILSALGLLAAFILVMGGINFQPKYKVFVDFDNPGGVQSGAPVKIAGVKIGTVENIEFRGQLDKQTGRREPLVRLHVSLEKRYQGSVYANSVFYVTTQGVLGEQFLAIEPGSSDSEVLAENASVRGLDPPRLDMLLAESYELLHSTVQAVRENRKELGETFDSLRSTLRGTGTFFANNGEKIDRIVDNVEQASIEGNELIKGANERFVKNPQVERILTNTDALTGELARETPALVAETKSILADGKVAVANGKRLSETLGSEAQQVKIQKAIDDSVTLLGKANTAADDATHVLAQMRKGRGTVGALLVDEQMFDDLQEMVRDLKHNPWKFFWRE
jgi:phospholipid/cholesterol/gamma-HCH transport system substrate-binding protein